MTNFRVERNWLDKEATNATQIIWMSRNEFVRNNRRKCQWQHIFIYFLRCGHSFTSNTLRMGLNLFVYRLPFLVTFLAYERVSAEWIRNSTRSKTELRMKPQKSRFSFAKSSTIEHVSSSGKFYQVDLCSQDKHEIRVCFFGVLHTAKNVLSLLLPNTLAEIVLPLFQLIHDCSRREKQKRSRLTRFVTEFSGL